MKATVLVVANRTATSAGLLTCLLQRVERSDTRFDLLVPPTVPGPAGRAEARQNLDEALARFADAGLEVTGRVGGDTDLVVAVIEAFDPARHDEILVSTLPASISHWLGADGPARIARGTGAIVRHVVAERDRPAPRVVHVERPPGHGVLAPFAALAHGGPRSA
jgi:hypothetical protein